MSASHGAVAAGPNPFPLSRYLSLAAVALVMLYPLLWLVGASFKSNAEIFSQIGFLPSRIDFGAYAKGWKTSTEYTFATYFLNSFAIVVPLTPGPLIPATVAFALSRLSAPTRLPPVTSVPAPCVVNNSTSSASGSAPETTCTRPLSRTRT